MKPIGVVSVLGLCCAAMLYVSGNTLLSVAVPTTRIDLTDDRLYTLSNGTRTVLSKIDEPISLHLFFSERLAREVPGYAAYERRVRELLHEMTNAAKGKLILNTHNPQPFSALEDLAVSFGVQGIPIDEGGELAYFGLAGTNSVDQVERIAFFQPQRENLLEYDLAELVHTLSNPEPAVIGFLSQLPVLGDVRIQMQGGVSLPWAMAKPLRDAFEVINLPQSFDELPASIDVMAVVHPGMLNDRVLYELEQFLFRGGRAALFLDPKAESDRRGGPNDIASSTASLKRLFDHWGINIPSAELIADRNLALRINAGSSSRPVPAPYLVWLNVGQDHLSRDDPVTNQLPALNLASVGHIVQRSDSPLTMTPLIVSSANSAILDVNTVRGLRPDVLGLLNSFRPDERTYVMAARLEGEVETAFADGPPTRRIPRAADSHDREQLSRSNGPIHLVIVADSDLFDDRFWVQKQEFFGREVNQPVAGNASFVVNLIGHLAGSDELMQLRSRGVSQRPFERVIALKRDAERRLQGKERALQEKLKQIQTHISALEGVSNAQVDATTGASPVSRSLSDSDRAEIGQRRREMLSIRKDLRDVQRGLRQDVERLETSLQFINIGLMPMLIASIALAVGLSRSFKRRRAYLGE